METTAIVTISRMLASLPEAAQNQVVEYLRDYIEELQDDERWDDLIKGSQSKLAAAARRARRQVSEGMAEPFDCDRL